MIERRRSERLEMNYNVEYGLFPSALTDKSFKKGVLKNIGSGGMLFLAESHLQTGTHLVVKVFISGWVIENGRAVISGDEADELPLEAIVEVLRSEHDPESDRYFIATKFLGRVHE